MKKSKSFFKLEQDKDDEVLWKKILIKPVRENINNINDLEFHITPDIQAYLTNTKLTTKFLDDVQKETVFV